MMRKNLGSKQGEQSHIMFLLNTNTNYPMRKNLGSKQGKQSQNVSSDNQSIMCHLSENL